MTERTKITAKTPGSKGRFSFPKTKKPGLSRKDFYPANQILQLQRNVGNREVQRLLESGTIQAKLTIGQPNDKYEQEADRVADQVIRMPDSAIQRQSTCPDCPEREEIQTKPIADQITPLVQRQVGPDEEEEVQTKIQRQVEEEEEPVQAKQANNQAPAVNSSIESGIQSLKGGGQPLPESTRSFFEPRFGTNFSHVRVHTDSKAAETAKSVNAKAFTTGKDVVFGAGQYSPVTPIGKSLLAHELTHVVQQKKARTGEKIQRINFSACNDPQEEVLREGIHRAHWDLRRALRLMDVPPNGVSQKVRESLWLAFRSESQETLERVKENITTIRDNLFNGHYVCNHGTGDCKGAHIYGYVPITGRRQINICLDPFIFYDIRIKSMAVIHEAAHRFLNVQDKGYFRLPSCREAPQRRETPSGRTIWGTEFLGPSVRIANADSYACFVHHLIHSSGSTVSESYRQYRGETSEIRSSNNQHVVYLQEGPNSHIFRLHGILPNSGMKLSWHLQVGGNIFSMETLERPPAYGGSIAVIPRNVRGRLSEISRIEDQRGRVVCEIELYYSGSTGRQTLRREYPVTFEQGNDPYSPLGI